MSGETNEAGAVRETDDGERHRVSVDVTAFDEPSVAIPAALAEVRGVDALDLPPLGRAVDTDALDRLLWRGAETDTEAETVTATVTYDGATITVSGDELHVVD